MDKKFLQALGIEFGLPRWQAYAMFIGSALGGVVFFYIVYMLICYFFG